MKKTVLKKRISVLLVMLMLMGTCITSFAAEGDTFNVGNLKYTVISDENKTVSVDGFVAAPTEAVLKIPDVVEDNEGTEYTVTEIGESAFDAQGTIHGSGVITSVELPYTIEKINNKAFYYYNNKTTKFTSISYYDKAGVTHSGEFPPSLTSIGDNAFNSCNNIDVPLVIPAGVKTIGKQAFASCWYIPSVTLNEGLETISEGAFNYCCSLTALVIPSTVTSLDYCIGNSNILRTIVFKCGSDTQNSRTSSAAYNYLGSYISGDITYYCTDEGFKTRLEEYVADKNVKKAGSAGNIIIKKLDDNVVSYGQYANNKYKTGFVYANEDLKASYIIAAYDDSEYRHLSNVWNLGEVELKAGEYKFYNDAVPNGSFNGEKAKVFLMDLETLTPYAHAFSSTPKK